MVRLGEYDLASNSDGANPIDVLIEQKIIHEEYIPSIILNDIALLKLRDIIQISGININNHTTTILK